MLDRLGAVINALREEGLRYTIATVAVHLLAFPAGVAFAFYDHLTSHDRRDLTITIRGTQPESDTYGLLDELAARDQDRTLHVLSHQQVDDTQLALWDDQVAIVFPQPHTLACFRALARSQVVLCKYDSHLKWYRWFDTSDRRYDRLYHGPITKAYGATRTGSEPQRIAENTSLVDTTPQYRSVESVVEKYFRASAEGRHPSRFPTWGYPRFDRVRRFLAGDADPVLSEDTRTILEDGEYTDILYAPTHKDGAYRTTFFPFPDADPDRLREWCRNHNVRLFLRPHPGFDAKYDHLVDDETIYFAGQTFANSATELMPSMDGLITDYSSIYIEFLPFDRPIIFVKDDHEQFLAVRGLAFDYERYFPGPKPETFEAFLTELARIDAGDDKYSDERAFVRKTFVPEREQTFLESVLDDLHRRS